MIGGVLGHYRILEKIGAGAMGEVYRARDQRLDRDVALKLLPAGTLVDEASRRRFRREALALSRLNHPNIETVYDFDTQDGTDFLVMELVPGKTLAHMLALERHQLPRRRLARRQVAGDLRIHPPFRRHLAAAAEAVTGERSSTEVSTSVVALLYTLVLSCRALRNRRLGIAMRNTRRQGCLCQAR